LDGILYTCRGDGFINAYNLTTFEIVRTFEGCLVIRCLLETGHNGYCKTILIDGEHLFSGGSDKLAKKWSIKTGRLMAQYSGLKLFIRCNKRTSKFC
jgi:WD40 repeat protein